MKQWRTFVLGLGIGLSALFLGGCADKNPVRVGVISGPEAQLMQVVKQVASERYGLSIKIIEFNDYILPNAALNEGSLEANLFQHQAYLNADIRNRHYDLAVIARAFIYPMGIYSQKIKDLKQLPAGAQVALPNDPSNEARALLLLEKAGLIQLKKAAGLLATPRDVWNNPKQLRFKELDAAQLSRVLADVELAVINTNYAVLADLYPSRDALFIENKQSPYANLLVVRTRDKDDARLQKLAKALHAPEVVAEAQRLFKGQAIAAW